MDIRCPNGIKFAELVEPGVIEVKCRSERCGAGSGVVVLHRFDTFTGDLISTNKYREPRKELGANNGARDHTAIRAA